MRRIVYKLKILILIAICSIQANRVLGAGYEKSIMFGARAAGTAGIAVPNATGSEALYYNPAGLVADQITQDASFNISPTIIEFKGPINNNNDVETSNRMVFTPFGLMYAKTLSDRFGFGVGGY